jgi:hypothetical protein
LNPQSSKHATLLVIRNLLKRFERSEAIERLERLEQHLNRANATALSLFALSSLSKTDASKNITANFSVTNFSVA